MDVRPVLVAGATLFLLVSTGIAEQSATSTYSIQDRIEGAKQSNYTSQVLALIQSWPPRDMPVPENEAHPVRIEGIRTPGNSNYIGLRKSVLIHAPVARVEQVFEDFPDYDSVFPGVIKVKMQKDANRFTTHWERESPAFFIPNIRFEEVFVSEDQGDRRFYRYQLRNGNSVNYADGLVVIEPKAADTLVSSYDFFEGDFGIAKVFAESKIWSDTLESYETSDLALKAKSENPDWKRKQIEASVEQYFKRNPMKLDEVRFFSKLEPVTQSSDQRLPAGERPTNNQVSCSSDFRSAGTA